MAHRSRLRLVGAVVAALSVLLAATAPLQAVTEAKEARMRFAYWTGCSPLKLFVSIPVEAARRMGLTEAAVSTAVRSRLRAARIYTDTDNVEVPLLVAQVALYYSEDQQIIGGAHAVRLSLYKHVHDPLSGLSGYAETKIVPVVGLIGIHDGKAAFILSGIARIMDSFIDDYLRVNEPACSRSPINP